MKKYQAPTDNFFCLPNNIFDLGLTPIQFAAYAYLVSCAGSKGYCWPSIEKIARKIGVGKTAIQEHLNVLQQRQIIAKSKRKTMSGHLNNVYTLLSLDNPEIYRDLTPPEELPLNIYDDLPAQRAVFDGIYFQQVKGCQHRLWHPANIGPQRGPNRRFSKKQPPISNF